MGAPDLGVPDGRTLLDAVVTAHRWTAEECVRHFADAATAMGESATLSAAQLKRWRRGRLVGLPRPTACRVAQRLFGFPVEELFAPVPAGFVPPLGVPDGVLARAQTADLVATEPAHARPGLTDGCPPSAVRWPTPGSQEQVDAVGSWGEESAVLLARLESSNVGPATIEYVQGQVVDIARAYVHAPLQPLFARM